MFKKVLTRVIVMRQKWPSLRGLMVASGQAPFLRSRVLGWGLLLLANPIKEVLKFHVLSLTFLL